MAYLSLMELSCRVACRVPVEFPVELSRPGLNSLTKVGNTLPPGHHRSPGFIEKASPRGCRVAYSVPTVHECVNSRSANSRVDTRVSHNPSHSTSHFTFRFVIHHLHTKWNRKSPHRTQESQANIRTMRKTQDAYAAATRVVRSTGISCMSWHMPYQRNCTSTCTTLCCHSTSRSSKGKPARMVYYWVYMAMNSS
jgi:hypothetical protein